MTLPAAFAFFLDSTGVKGYFNRTFIQGFMPKRA